MSMSDELADQLTEIPDQGVTDSGEIGSDKPLSLRDQITNSVKEVEKETRSRDTKTGKFAKPEGADKSAASPDIPEPKKDAQPEAKKAVGPPPGWSAESKAFFDSLPADHPLKQDVEKREREVSDGFKSKSEELKKYQEVEQALAPHRPVYQQAGLKSDGEAINRLFQWENAIRSNPVQGLAQLARAYGVDLSQFAQSHSAPSNGGQELPEHLKPVLNQFGQLSQTVQSLQSRIVQADQEKVQSELATFAKDKPHFERVRVAMGQMMKAGIVEPGDLQGAYDRALWADPELRNELLKEQDEKRQSEFVKKQQEMGTRARAAAVSPAPRAKTGQMVNGADKGAKGIRGSILSSVQELRERDRA